MTHKYESSKNRGHCGQQVIDLQNLMGRSSEIIINVDSQTEIQVSVKENRSKICTVVKKSSDNMGKGGKKQSKRGMCPISESLSEGSMDMASYQRKNLARERVRRQDSCMEGSMMGMSENRRRRQREVCEDPCMDRSQYGGTRDLYDKSCPSSSKRDTCEMRSRRKEDPCKMVKKDPCSERGQRKGYDPCMNLRDEKRFKQPSQSKGTRYDERCECPTRDTERTKDQSRDMYDRKKCDPCSIPKEWLKKYPCLSKPRDPCGGTNPCKMDYGKKREGTREDPCKMDYGKKREATREDPCKMVYSKKREGTREDPCKKKEVTTEDPCKRKEISKKPNDDYCKPKDDPCKPKCPDALDKTRSRTSKADPCSSGRMIQAPADLGRYESISPSCQTQASCLTLDPCKDPCAEDDGTNDAGANNELSPSPSKLLEDKNMEELGLEDAKRRRSSFQIDEENEEVWIVQCPKTVDLRELVGAKIKLGGSKTHFNVDEVSIDCSTHEYSENRVLSLAAGNGKIRQMDTVGAIKIKKRSVSTPDMKSPESIKREASKIGSTEILSPKRKKSNKIN